MSASTGRKPDREHRGAVQRAAQLAHRVRAVLHERLRQRRVRGTCAPRRTPARRPRPRPSTIRPSNVGRTGVVGSVGEVLLRPQVSARQPLGRRTRAREHGRAAFPRGPDRVGGEHPERRGDDVGGNVAERATAAGDVEVHAFEAERGAAGEGGRIGHEPRGCANHDRGGVVRGLFRRHGSKYGLRGRATGRRSPTEGRASRPASERGERRGFVVRVDRGRVAGGRDSPTPPR